VSSFFFFSLVELRTDESAQGVERWKRQDGRLVGVLGHFLFLMTCLSFSGTYFYLIGYLRVTALWIFFSRTYCGTGWG
jgi:cytochrome c oxidase subunit IV